MGYVEKSGKIERDLQAEVSRRGLLEGAAGLTFALTIPGALVMKPAAALAQGTTVPTSVGAWITISPDGAMIMAIPVAEMGQGTSTGLGAWITISPDGAMVMAIPVAEM